MNQKVDVVINKRRLTVEIEGLTAMEVVSLAGELSNKMEEIEEKSKIYDSSKLAILTALEYAAEVSRLKASHDDLSRVVEHKLAAMTLSLQKALAADQSAP